jgi:hypothetical protein
VERQSRDKKNQLTQRTKKVVGLLLVEVVSTIKNTPCGKGCGWLASSRGSKYEKKHIDAKEVVGLPVGDRKNNREFD